METYEAFNSVNSRLDKLERRMIGIEDALNRLLTVFGQPTIEAIDTAARIDSSADAGASANVVVSSEPTVLPLEGEYGPTSQQLEDVDSNGPFSYNPLNSSKSEIRVLALKPSTDPSASLIADLFTQSLDEEQYAPTSTWKPYAALSYTWGEAIFDGSITLNGKPFAVTASLEAALRAMRGRNGDPSLMQTSAWPHDGTTPNYWWIDQICIDQQNLDERNEQVALMRRIYKRAACVQVWLGEKADGSDVAMNLLQAIGTTPIRQPGEKEIVYPSFDPDDVKDHWWALEALFRRPWWERVWIRQEVALSSQVSFVCGSKSVGMEAIGPATAAMRYVRSLGWPATNAVDEQGSDGIPLPVSHHPESILALHEATNGGYSYEFWCSSVKVQTSGVTS